MVIKRRDFINLSAMAATAGIVTGISSCASNSQTKENKPVADDLQSMTTDVVPITLEEREARIDKAQRLMAEQKMAALILDSGISLKYFTGISWWPSERPMVAIIPAKGEPNMFVLVLKKVVSVN